MIFDKPNALDKTRYLQRWLTISRYLGRLRSSKTMITREVNYELGVILKEIEDEDTYK